MPQRDPESGPSMSEELTIRYGSNATHQSPQVPNINRTSPGHLKHDLWSSIDIRLLKGTRLT